MSQPMQVQSQKRIWHWIAILAIFFPPMIAIMPLTRFGEGMEDFNVLTAIEIERTGQWALPTLWGYPRLEKPPLAEWLAAVGLRLGGPLEIAPRWPLALVSVLSLIVVYEWARGLGDWRHGLVAAVAAGTTLFYIRFTRRAAYDGSLMFWVALANLGLTWILFQKRLLAGTIIAILALGGGILTKGPPPLLHTVLPWVICCLAVSFYTWRKQGRYPMRWSLSMLALALLISVAAGLFLLPWVLTAIAKLGGIQAAMDVWKGELARLPELAEGRRTSPLSGLVFFLLLMPWMLWYIGAAIMARRNWQKDGPMLAYLLTMSFLPVVIHALMPVMQHRYLVPMVPAAAVIVSLVFLDFYDRQKSGCNFFSDRLVVISHFLILLGLLVVMPLFWAFKPDDDMLQIMPACMVAAIALVVVLAGWWWQQRWAGALVVTTLVAMLGYQVLYSYDKSGVYAEAKAAVEDIQRRGISSGELYCDKITLDKTIAIYLDVPIRSVPDINALPPGGQRYFLAQSKSMPAPQGSQLIASYTIDGKALNVWKLP